MSPKLRRGLAVGEAAVAFALIALGGVLWAQAGAIPVSPLYATIGPTAFPYAVAAGLIGLGGLNLVQALRGGWPPDDPADRAPPDMLGLGWIAAALIFNLATIERLGFVLAATGMFAMTARAFGSDRPARDAGLGLVVATLAFVGFDRLLGVQIGAGLIEDLLRGG